MRVAKSTFLPYLTRLGHVDEADFFILSCIHFWDFVSEFVACMIHSFSIQDKRNLKCHQCHRHHDKMSSSFLSCACSGLLAIIYSANYNTDLRLRFMHVRTTSKKKMLKANLLRCLVFIVDLLYCQENEVFT